MDSPPEGKREVFADVDPDPDDVEWYLGLDGAILGPMEMEELARRLTRCPAEADVLVWQEDLPEWVEPDALPETAHLFSAEPLATQPAGPEALEDFLVHAEGRGSALPAEMPPLLAPTPPPDDAPLPRSRPTSTAKPPPAQRAAPAPGPAPKPAPRSRWTVLLLGIMALTMLVGLATLLSEPRSDSVGAAEPEAPVAPPTARSAPPAVAEAKPKRPVQAPRPRVFSKNPSAPLSNPLQPSPAAPGEEALPSTKEGQRKWLTDVQTQLRDLRKKRGKLLQDLQREGNQKTEGSARKRSELRQMKYRFTAAHKLRGRLLDALAVDAPPLPQAP